MIWSLYDCHGQRKYLTAPERGAFLQAAMNAGGPTATFCAVMAFCGPRISEVLALTPERIDISNRSIVFETLKRRERGVFRAVPIPGELIDLLDAVHDVRAKCQGERERTQRLWPWGRTTAWKRVKSVMAAAGIAEGIAKPKAMRHAFGVGAAEDRIALSLIKKWLGHARIQTTEIYTTPIGKEERRLAALMWRDMRKVVSGAALQPLQAE